MISGFSTRSKVLLKMTAGVIVPSVPVLIWWKSAVDDRNKRSEEVRTKVRVPNVQTIDDLLVEKCKPGDIILFDRRCEKCAAGPIAALSCLLSRQFLCKEDPMQTRAVETGTFDHCGIVVPGKAETAKDELDPSNLLFLEATASDGVVARPLLTRLEMSQSRSVILLPLAGAGERRNDEDYEPSEKVIRANEYMKTQLTEFRDRWAAESQKQDYASGHSTLGIIGSLAYATGLHITSPAPTSPSAWLVLSALQSAGIGENLSDRTVLETRVEDFLRDHRFNEKDTVRLRPGWKFLPAVTMRETSRS
mmetsp:Transcript_16392/g.23124  ORF Transcript_16392/g.23124 Transcript_16392/m.23124 type:complete len:306 (-) Transcript_16392:124-1041(-)